VHWRPGKPRRTVMFNIKSFDWSPIRESLLEVLSFARDPLAAAGLQQEVADVQEYLDVGEYGLALEDLCGLLAESHIPLPPRMYALIERAGTTMLSNGGNLDPAVWEQLRSP
jgi:hypothetical protein